MTKARIAAWFCQLAISGGFFAAYGALAAPCRFQPEPGVTVVVHASGAGLFAKVGPAPQIRLGDPLVAHDRIGISFQDADFDGHKDIVVEADRGMADVSFAVYLWRTPGRFVRAFDIADHSTTTFQNMEFLPKQRIMRSTGQSGGNFYDDRWKPVGDGFTRTMATIGSVDAPPPFDGCVCAQYWTIAGRELPSRLVCPSQPALAQRHVRVDRASLYTEKEQSEKGWLIKGDAVELLCWSFAYAASDGTDFRVLVRFRGQQTLVRWVNFADLGP